MASAAPTTPAAERHIFKAPEVGFKPTSTRVWFPYIVAVVVPELQAEVLLLQQLQMAADFVEEVSP